MTVTATVTVTVHPKGQPRKVRLNILGISSPLEPLLEEHSWDLALHEVPR